MNALFTPQSINVLYSTFMNKKKERFDIILEPFQAITQLALLSFCPIGTKIAIQNNLLEIQYPSVSQPLIRWFNNDNKEDLFYLFNACRRFTLFYSYLQLIQDTGLVQDEINNEKDIDDDKNSIYTNHTNQQTQNDLYHLLIICAKEGFNKLSQTYGDVNKVSLLHTLQMYKVILDNPSFFDFQDNHNNQSNQNSPALNYSNTYHIYSQQPPPLQLEETTYHNDKHMQQNQQQNKNKNKQKQNNKQVVHLQNQPQNQTQSPLFQPSQQQQPISHQSPLQQPMSIENNIDSIFINIRNLYKNEELYIVFNILKLLQSCEEQDAIKYVNGLNIIMKSPYMKIKKWINDNIVF
jgi:hypothetical protein